MASLALTGSLSHSDLLSAQWLIIPLRHSLAPSHSAAHHCDNHCRLHVVACLVTASLSGRLTKCELAALVPSRATDNIATHRKRKTTAKSGGESLRSEHIFFIVFPLYACACGGACGEIHSDLRIVGHCCETGKKRSCRHASEDETWRRYA